MTSVTGLHHITAIAADPRENLEFYTGVLGLRLVKRTVNQDAPDTYHLFYADAEGNPGTDITFFPWPRMGPARRGTGLAIEVGFSVPPGSLQWWAERLERSGVGDVRGEERFGSQALSFRDPHGLGLALVETREALATSAWELSTVPEEHQLRGFHGVRLWERDARGTTRFLREALGFEAAGSEDGWQRFEAGEGGPSRLVEVRELPDERRGAWGTGAVHHVAFRVPDRDAQAEIRERIQGAGGAPTDFIDRFWFRSIYFKEPGGVLFEVATDGPGFGVDEDPETLGDRLILPPWLEPRRAGIEADLPPIGAAVTAG